jgi:3-oxoacyl-[acyl-carrier protein] reductase
MGVAVVTGAGQGLIAVDLRADAAEATAKEIGGQWRQCDVADRDAVMALGESIEHCDILVNNAGIWKFHSLLDMSVDDAQSVIDVNVLGLIWCTQAFVPKMRAAGGGAIVNLSSGAAWTHSPGLGIYAATKSAVESLTKTMAIELGPQGIRANAIGPGLIVSAGTAANYQGERANERAKGVPLGRVGSPEDIADVVAFLVGNDARYVSGQIIYVDGAVTAGRASL